MKRLLPVIPIIFLFFINSCGSPISIETVETIVVQTQIAASWTPTHTPTVNPNLPTMVNSLNNDVYTVNSLGWLLDAEYYVTDIKVTSDSNGRTQVFRVDVNCVCMNATDCCIPERTFVVVVEAMKRNQGIFLSKMPGEVSEVIVVCFNQQTKEQLGAISASWQNVQGYLQGSVTGYQLGVRVTRTAAP